MAAIYIIFAGRRCTYKVGEQFHTEWHGVVTPLVGAPLGKPERVVTVPARVHPAMYLLNRRGNIILVSMKTDAIECVRNVLQCISRPDYAILFWDGSTGRSIDMVCLARQVGVVHVIDGIMGILDKSKI